MELKSWRHSIGPFISAVSILYIAFILICIFATRPIGEFPLFSGIHRRFFMLEVGHELQIVTFFKTISYASVVLGMFQSANLLYSPWRSFRPWLPLLAWSSSVVFLLFLGHRFSSLIVNSYFFMLPLMVNLLHQRGGRFLRFIYGGGAILGLISLVMFTHSFVVGGFHKEDKMGYLRERILVDQSALWHQTVSDLYEYNEDRREIVNELTFFSPLTDKIHNRAAQVLMFKEIGANAFVSWDEGHMISVSYPENIIYLVGRGWIFLVTLVLGLFLASLLFVFYESIIHLHLIRATLMIVLLNPIFVLFLGVSPHTVISVKFLAKIAAVGCLYFLCRFAEEREFFVSK